ncbi:hypothetical protein DUNSADRAFT_3677 [Dunaliella salina]|uniref:Uncharacterized protein n=1 Tax=Dunaliella salina TaxID=3046 RepID=A0ABQ7FV93_DUNSA|nr:hypothetical protein DUNSADRAFT_3677 [Dunaliella salina]|eukprot:KAF5826305.1 hypothetical protein DUNSADRAFT_3677 [Dunaliella salina]
MFLLHTFLVFRSGEQLENSTQHLCAIACMGFPCCSLAVALVFFLIIKCFTACVGSVHLRHLVSSTDLWHFP